MEDEVANKIKLAMAKQCQFMESKFMELNDPLDKMRNDIST